MRIDDIRTEIANILATVPTIGKIIHGIVFIRSASDLELVRKDGIVNSIGFFQVTILPQDTEEDYDTEEETRRFVFVYYFEHNDYTDLTKSSFVRVEKFAEYLQDAFNSNEDLNGTVSTHSKLALTSNNLTPIFNNEFVHMLTFEMETKEIFEQ